MTEEQEREKREKCVERVAQEAAELMAAIGGVVTTLAMKINVLRDASYYRGKAEACADAALALREGGLPAVAEVFERHAAKYTEQVKKALEQS